MFSGQEVESARSGEVSMKNVASRLAVVIREGQRSLSDTKVLGGGGCGGFTVMSSTKWTTLLSSEPRKMRNNMTA